MLLLLLLLKLDYWAQQQRTNPYLANGQLLYSLHCYAWGRLAAGLSELAFLRDRLDPQSWAVYTVEARVKLEILDLKETAVEKVFVSLLTS